MITLFIKFVLSRAMTSLLEGIHVKWEINKFSTEQKSWKFLLAMYIWCEQQRPWKWSFENSMFLSTAFREKYCVLLHDCSYISSVIISQTEIELISCTRNINKWVHLKNHKTQKINQIMIHAHKSNDVFKYGFIFIFTWWIKIISITRLM